MPVSVANSWSGGYSILGGYSTTYPVGQSAQFSVGNQAGNWLVAMAAWQSPAGFATTVSFGDDAGNHWIPLGAPAGTSSAAGDVRSAIWAAPCAGAATRVWVSPSGWAPAVAVVILELAGMSPGMSLQAIDTGWVNAGTAVTVALPAPAVAAVAFTCAGMDDNVPSLTLSGSAWNAFPQVVTSDGADHLADLTFGSAWLLTSGSVTATWTAGSSADLGACTAAVAVSQPAPAGPSQGWPRVKFEAAFGAGIGTPWDQLTWTDLTTRYQGLSGQRGRQYELDSVQASSTPVILSNNDGALTPGNASSPYNLGISGWTARNGATLALSRAYAWTGPASMLMAPDGVTSGTYAESAQVAVTASTSGYSGSAAVYSPQGWATVGVAIRWYNSGGGFISSSAGTGVTAAAGQWCYPQVSASSPVGAAFATLNLTVNGTAPSTTLFWWDFAQLTSPAGAVLNGNSVFATGADVYVPARLKATWLGREYVQWRGFMERWPGQLSASRYTRANATATDVYAGLTSLQPTPAAGEILLDNPWGYWPCSDPAGALQAANLAPTQAGPLTVVESKFGPGPGGTQAFGGSSSLLGAPSGCWAQSGLNSGSTDITHGFCLQSRPSVSNPPVSNGLTVEAWANFGAVPEPNGRLLIWALQGTAGTIAELWGNYDGSVSGVGFYLTVYDKATRTGTSYRVLAVGIQTTPSGSAAPPDGWWHFAVTLTPTAWQVYINGGGVAASIGSGTCNLAPSFQWVTWGGAADRILTGQSSNISLEGLAVYPAVLQQTRVIAHYFAVQNGLAGDTTERRMGRLLSYAHTLVPRRLGATADSVQPATDISGQACAQNVTNMAQSDAGLLFADRCGYLALDNRSARWNRAVAWNAGEDAGAILNQTWDFESGVFPWTAVGGATLSASAASAWTGSQSLLITPNGAAATPGAVSEKCGIIAGSTVTGTVMLLCPGGYASGALVAVTFFNPSGGITGSNSVTDSPLASGSTWSPVTVTGTAPAGTSSAALTVQLQGTPASSVLLYADQALLTLAGEVPYLGDFSPDFDPSQVFDDLMVTQYQGITVAASSPTSMHQYGDLTLQETVYLSDPDLTTDLTNWVLATYAQPSTRVATFTVDAAANPYAWQFVLSTDVGTVVQVSRRLQGTQVIIQSPFVIQTVSLANAQGQWKVTYAATPYYLDALATNDPVKGLPNGTNPIAWLRGGGSGCSTPLASPSARGPPARPR